MRISRRDWLKGASGAAALGLGGLSLTSGAFGATSGLDYIDAHAHIYSGEMSQVTGVDSLDPVNLPKIVKFTLDELDKAGASMAIFSVGTAQFFYDPDSAGKARRFNENFARIVSDHPTRFRFFANLPIPTQTDACLKEIDYALGTLKASGIQLYASHGAKWMGDPIYTPIFEELNRRKVVVKTHPVPNDCCKVTGMGVTENGFDTMRAITTMLQTGASARYPDMKIIWSHAGGALLGLVERFVGDYDDNSKLHDVMPNGPEYELRRFYYDTAQSEHPATLAALKRLIPMDHLMFGTDFPHRMPVQCRKKVEQSGVFNAAELRGLASGNVRRLLSLA